jgi:D-alanyl-D-alanine carboxypeptidase/D-alanyl-D-alanine-endopeptidase (penicillin-binding protein 4)
VDRIIRLFVPVLATALVWTAVFVGVSSSEVSSKSTDAEEVTVAPRATVSATVERIEDSRSGFEPEPSRLRTCELLGPDSLPIPSTLSGMVVDNATGDTLFDAEASTPHPTASVVKIVTATAALRVLGPDHRLTTTVVAGGAGEIFLVGGGDVTLTRAPGSNYYDSEASLQSLATQTLEKLDRDNLETVVVRSDGSRYEDFPVWDSTWRSGSAALGFVAPVTALQVDGDRDQPLRRLSPRSMNPELRAIEWFAEVTRAAGPQLNVRVGQPDTAPPGAIVLAQVDSAPVGELIGIMLRDSDNSLSEVLAREVALSLGTTNIGSALLEGASLGSWEPSDGSVHGGSGLSSQTTLSHDVITRLLRDIDRDVELSAIRDNLPIAAQTGSLRNRYLAVSPELAGRVEAKTGSIQGTRSLAGYLLAEDGSELIFSFNASGAGVDNQSRDEIDRLLANVSRCGSNLVG